MQKVAAVKRFRRGVAMAESSSSFGDDWGRLVVAVLNMKWFNPLDIQIHLGSFVDGAARLHAERVLFSVHAL